MFPRMLILSTLMTFLLQVSFAPANLPAQEAPQRSAPTIADFLYGQDSERQKFDFWQAKSKDRRRSCC